MECGQWVKAGMGPFEVLSGQTLISTKIAARPSGATYPAFFDTEIVTKR